MSDDQKVPARDVDILARLYETIVARKGADAAESYTAHLLAGGPKAICRKIGEEAIEVTIEGLKGDGQSIARESADLIYHLMVLWADAGVVPDEIWAELARREGVSGHDEKASRGNSENQGED